jgi:hypothetical protein
MSHMQFTMLIRLPFARGNFVDPPQVREANVSRMTMLTHVQVQWDADRDRQLWKVISKSSKTSDLDCELGGCIL